MPHVALARDAEEVFARELMPPARRVRPRAVRDAPALLAGYQKRLTAQGVELRWPG